MEFADKIVVCRSTQRGFLSHRGGSLLEAAQNLTENGGPMLFDPLSFALLLTLSVLAVIFLILAVERLWLMRKNSGPGAEDYRAGLIKY